MVKRKTYQVKGKTYQAKGKAYQRNGEICQIKGNMSQKKFTRKNLRSIQDIVQSKTGADIVSDRRTADYRFRRTALLAGSLFCFAILCAFGYAKFSDLNGDTAGFAPAYQGDGKFEIVIMNDSDRELKLQDTVKVMQWSTGEEVEGDNDRIRMSGSSIAPHSQGVVSIDISEGYDVEAMQENLGEADGYYFVLTNNNFAFGQDWMCFFTFDVEQTEAVRDSLAVAMEERAERQAEREQTEATLYQTGELISPAWIWPTVSRNISAPYGEQANGVYSDHINIAGTEGDDVYAAADGIVLETGYEAACGNAILLDLGDGVTVKYGHLKEIQVSVGDEVKQGQVIGTLGKSGMATGPNLLFAVTVDGEAVDPLAEQ